MFSYWRKLKMTFKPIRASKNIVDDYIRYLSTMFQFDDEAYQQHFEHKLKNDKVFANGPYLDVIASFEKGRSINELCKDQVLSSEFRRINMPKDRPLYRHQENALEYAIKGENLIVSTGTGSGKTESFLLPILHQLTKEIEMGTLKKGVRALIIYPMNALANDQIERFRELLKDIPEITFGSYTGQTKEKYYDALALYKSLNKNEMPLENELISREQMKNTPPNILVTNYAMLEYLLLRPQDNELFTIYSENDWKFIVLDEAHVYQGATGIEVSMLLRRLNARLMKPNVQYILTSATLGDQTQNQLVAKFGENLCNGTFKKENIIRASRIEVNKPMELFDININRYLELANYIDDENSDLLKEYLRNHYSFIQENSTVEEMLYELIEKDVNYWTIKEFMKEPSDIVSISKYMGWSESEVEAFVSVAAKAEKDDIKLFDARYHMFLRAPESVFITLDQNKEVYLNRRKSTYINEQEIKVFEVATCQICHSIYLLGTISGDYFVQNDDHNSERTLYYLGDKYSDTDEDHLLESQAIKVGRTFELCTICGKVHDKKLVNRKYCSHGQANYIDIIAITCGNESGKLTKCVSCENVNRTGILRQFYSGQEALTSVIGTSLFLNLPSSKKTKNKVNKVQSLFGKNKDKDSETITNLAKQFIAFSDSRQAAAYYASYMSLSYENIMHKRVIVEVLKKFNYEQRVGRLVDLLSAEFSKKNICEDPIREAWISLLDEMINSYSSNSLLSYGLLKINIPDMIEDIFEESNLEFLNLKCEEVRDLVSVLIVSMLSDAAISNSGNLKDADIELFTYSNKLNAYVENNSESKKVKKFIPQQNRLNKRMDYIHKVLTKTMKEESIEIIESLAKFIWEEMVSSKILVSANTKKLDGEVAYCVDESTLTIEKPQKVYQCSKCNKITPYNVANVCPAYRCHGELIEVKTDELFKNNHYYNLYNNIEIRPLRIVEHTAQLSKEVATEYQNEFKNKEIDVLSCSTTFEMGVDVGSLETVFMRNMPPSASNYAQRAGRAGRSKHSAAYALTFCNRASHDFHYFNHPTKMINGIVYPPRFDVANDKIVRRHIYASALGFFWKNNSELFGMAISMTTMSEQNGYKLFENYLNSKPKDLLEYLLDVVPVELHDKYAIKDFGWIHSLIGENGIFTLANDWFNEEVRTLDEAIKENYRANQPIDYLSRRKKVYTDENVLSFLSRKSVLPKYGFPVDSVELEYKSKGNNPLQLSRDLAMAIAEYAPGCEVVADNKLIKSNYIKKMPSKSWKMYDYYFCKECNSINIALHISREETDLTQCSNCKLDIQKKEVSTFIVPEFGFEAENKEAKRPSLIKPEKTYRTEAAYISSGKEMKSMVVESEKYRISLKYSKNDEMAIVNTSPFFVCEKCGFSTLESKKYMNFNSYTLSHNRSSGHKCSNNQLYKYSLGYRFATDIIHIEFEDPMIPWSYSDAYSILQALLKGISVELSIEESDISGCLQYNHSSNGKTYTLLVFDTTPGGSGHVKKILDDGAMDKIIKQALNMMLSCDCGGDDGDDSCYSCLRTYRNQKYHNKLSRKTVISYLERLY